MILRIARASVVFIITLSAATASAAVVIGRFGRTVHVATTTQYVAQCGHEPSLPQKLKRIHYFGIIADRTPGTKKYRAFVRQAEVTPTIVDYFVSFGLKWDPVPACYAVSQGALPLLQINLYGPRHLSNGLIDRTLDGHHYDGYLTQFADQIKNFGLPVVLSLGHEMNGNWYPWGWTGDPKVKVAWNACHRTRSCVPPKVFVEFWQYVHHIFAQLRVWNAIWLWTVNRAVNPATSPIAWWPGNKYVNWVGIDGHYPHPTDRFKTVFLPTISMVRRFTSDPILIAESAIRPGPERPAQIADLYNTVFHMKGMLGVIYFDMAARFNWQLTDAASITAFRKAVKQYERSAIPQTPKRH